MSFFHYPREHYKFDIKCLQLLDSRNTIVLYRISQTDNAAPVPKLTTTLVLPWEANCSTIFSASCLLRDFSDEFKFYKTVSFSQTKHLAVAPFPMMLFKGFCFVWFKSFGSACRNDGLRQDVQRISTAAG
jgi:hypothetical protein